MADKLNNFDQILAIAGHHQHEDQAKSAVNDDCEDIF